MSTIKVAEVTTENGETNLTLGTGNSAARDIVIYANGVMAVGNATANIINIYANAEIKITNGTSEAIHVMSNTVVHVPERLLVGALSGHDFGGHVIVEMNDDQNTYVQTIIQNANSGTNASGDLVITSDSGTDNTNFIDLGINGSQYNNSAFNIGGRNDGYVYTSNSNLLLGTALANSIIFHANGTTSDKRVMRVNANGTVTVTNSIYANVFIGAAAFPWTGYSNSTVGAFASAPQSAVAATGTLGLTANRQYFIPFIMPYTATTTTLACEVTTLGSGSSIRMNIYGSNETGGPTGSPLGADVIVSSASTGVKTGAYAVTLIPGKYYASMLCNATAPTVRSVLPVSSLPVRTVGTNAMGTYVYGSFTYGTMGAVTGVTSFTQVVTNTQCPIMIIY
jgi:hypothetical protein